jgi:hypothetical protein
VPTAAALTVAELGSKLVERKHSPLTNDLLFHPFDHIRDMPHDGADSSLLHNQLFVERHILYYTYLVFNANRFTYIFSQTIDTLTKNALIVALFLGIEVVLLPVSNILVLACSIDHEGT